MTTPSDRIGRRTKSIGVWIRHTRIHLRIGLTSWTAAALAAILLTTLPLLVIFFGVFGEAGDTWRHLASTVLWTYVLNSSVLLAGVGALTLVIGVSTAWFVTTFDFPGRRTFEWALILPLAIPTYIIAYTYAELFDFSGPVQRFLGLFLDPSSVIALKGWVMSMGGVIFLMAFVLYPYVYLITRASLAKRSGSILESARILGKSPWQTFFQVALPMARPAVAAGLALVLMEVLNEYGAVKFFGIPTFTTGIFRAWFPLNDPDAAIRLSGCLLLFVFFIIAVERFQRGRARYVEESSNRRPAARIRLEGRRAWGVFVLCLLPVTFGFLVPGLQLLLWAGRGAGSALDARFLTLMGNSFGLAAAAAFVAVAAATLIAYAVRLSPMLPLRWGSRLALLGYSIPGTVVAVGVFIPLLWLDRRLNGVSDTLFGTTPGLILSGTAVALVLAYVVRFLAVALNPVDSGFTRVCGDLDESARSLGARPMKALWKVDLPLLRGTLVSAGLLVFVDVLKELPLTLILRPFNFDTLATRAFQLATGELVAQSALPALLIIAAGLLPVLLLNRLMGTEEGPPLADPLHPDGE